MPRSRRQDAAGFVLVLDARSGRIILRPCQRRPRLAVNIANVTSGVALARALVAEPKLVIADEPTSMLDASLSAGILELILGIRDRFGTAFVYITHDLALARWVSDRMIVMRQGKIVEVGPATMSCTARRASTRSSSSPPARESSTVTTTKNRR